MAALVQQIETFCADNPGIEFSVTYYASSELRAAYEAAAAEGQAPTILLGPDLWGPDLWEAGLIQDVSDLLAPGMRQTIQPLALSQVQFGEAVLGVPLEMQGVVLYANRAMMPEPSTTVAGLVANPGAADLGFDFTASFLASCGGRWIGTDGQPAFGGSAGLCWLNLVATLAQAGPTSFNTDDDLGRFESGQAAWILGGTWNRERLASVLGEGDLAVDPWPTDEVTGAPLSGHVWTQNAYLTAGLQPADMAASWELVRYLLSQEVQTALSGVDGAAHLPAITGVWLDDPLMERTAIVLSQGVPFPIQPEIALYRTPAERAVFAVLRQGAAPEAALQRAVQEIESVLSQER